MLTDEQRERGIECTAENGATIRLFADYTVEEFIASAVEAARAEDAATIVTLRDAYRDAIGVPESDHQKRRMEDIARSLERALAERDAARAAERALVERVEAEVADMQTFMLLPAIAAARIRAALTRPDAEELWPMTKVQTWVAEHQHRAHRTCSNKAPHNPHEHGTHQACYGRPA